MIPATSFRLGQSECSHTRIWIIAVLISLVLWLAAPKSLSAVELRNESDTTQLLFVDEAGQNRTLAIEPGQLLKRICPNGCTITTEKGEVLLLKGGEKLKVNKRAKLVLAE